ncbi:MAG: hypothetical protein ACXVPQ_09505 [Bacteroidia bacterium]
MTFNLKILVLLAVVFSCAERSSAQTINSQNLTSSPYSRYGIGELGMPSFASNAAMGGTFIGLKPDTMAPIFINAANPAAITGIRYTTLELGGLYQFNSYTSSSTTIKDRTANFAYGSLGFPIKQKASACFGLMPYSNVGYNMQTVSDIVNIGHITNNYTGSGGINRAFLGIGVSPFKSSLNKFNRSARRDTLVKYHRTGTIKRIKFFRELISELSIGGKGSYLFGTMNQTATTLYEGSIMYYNNRRIRSVRVGDVTGDFGIQTAFNIDSVGHRELRHKIKIGIGYFIGLPKMLNVKYSNLIYNYNLDGYGGEVPTDTVLNTFNQKSTIRLPLEQGVGLCFKKGELLSVAVDFAYTNWQQFRYLDNVNELKNSYRTSIGISYVPDKGSQGSGAYPKRIQYRIGASFNTAYLELKNTPINNYMITAGLGLPVGLFRQFSAVNITGQFGTMGSVTNNLIQQKYIRLILGFTFNDKWFNKFRYD